MARSTRDRRLLDQRLAAWRSVPAEVPARGWLRAIRENLGMPRSEAARRLGLTEQAVARMERAEADGSIRLETLRRAAAALDCTVVYALVPPDSLEAIVDERAHALARARVTGVEHTMALEDQVGGARDAERLVDELADQLKRSRSLWRE